MRKMSTQFVENKIELWEIASIPLSLRIECFPCPFPELNLLVGSEIPKTFAVFFQEQLSVKTYLFENNFTVFNHAYFQAHAFRIYSFKKILRKALIGCIAFKVMVSVLR